MLLRVFFFFFGIKIIKEGVYDNSKVREWRKNNFFFYHVLSTDFKNLFVFEANYSLTTCGLCFSIHFSYIFIPNLLSHISIVPKKSEGGFYESNITYAWCCVACGLERKPKKII